MFFIGGCVTVGSDIVPVGKDTYKLGMTGVGFATQSGTNMKALSAASEHCSKMGKKLEVQDNTESGVYGFVPRQSSLTFKCVSEYK